MHFAGVLLISLMMLLPWPFGWLLGAVVGLTGIGSAVYQLTVIRARLETELVQTWWGGRLPYTVVPAIASVCLISGSLAFFANWSLGPFLVAAGTFALLCSALAFTARGM